MPNLHCVEMTDWTKLETAFLISIAKRPRDDVTLDRTGAVMAPVVCWHLKGPAG